MPKFVIERTSPARTGREDPLRRSPCVASSALKSAGFTASSGTTRAAASASRRLVEALDRPTSFELIGNTPYVRTLGEIWKVTNVAGPPRGRRP